MFTKSVSLTTFRAPFGRTRRHFSLSQSSFVRAPVK